MNASEIKVGEYYAATRYNTRPRVDTDLVMVHVLGQNKTSGGGQTRFPCKVVGELDHYWEPVKYSEDQKTDRVFRSGQIFMPWKDFLKLTEERRKLAKEHRKEREKKEKREEEKRENRKEMIREVAALTGVWLLDLDNKDEYTVRTSIAGIGLRVHWDKVAELLESLQTQKKLIGEASRDAMDLLNDVF